LEPLLATPISTAELLIGKGAAACIPGVVATWIGFAVFAAGTFVIVPSRLMVARILDPMWLVAIFVVGPLMALAAVSLAIIVSARVSDPRTAEQVSMVIILPLMGLFFAQIAGVILVNMQVLLLVALLMALVDVGLVYLGVRAFQRETILTKWK
jgi:ABC-2 type transport system permease protein